MNKSKNLAIKQSSQFSDSYTYLDLFCGCGGFSLGLEEAGLVGKAAIDFNQPAIETFKKNFPKIPNVFCKDLTQFGPLDLDELLNGERIDVIVGGPPCQGFSHARQVDGANHGKRLVDDPRRHLYQEFLKYVGYFQPKIFVMENVLGIRSAAGGEFFTRVQSEARELGYRVHSEVVRAWRYGVPQKRVRQLIIGTRRELPLFVGKRHLVETHALAGESSEKKTKAAVTLWEAIGDLPPLSANSGNHESKYDQARQAIHIAKYGGRYLRNVLQVHKTDKLTGHVSRPHSARDLRDFARLKEGEHSAAAIARGEEMEFPYDRENFKDRFTRQHRHDLCSTIVAHLSKDGLMFIHPTQNRSITPREAARIQSFPDWFELPEQRTHSFRIIGNAVAPLVGYAVGQGIKSYLAECSTPLPMRKESMILMPRSAKEAEKCLEELLSMEKKELRSAAHTFFLKGWFALAYIHVHLHPDATDEHGTVTNELTSTNPLSRIFSPIYERSGWPVALVPLLIEARRRLNEGELSDDDFYCSPAFVAGAVINKK